LNQICEGLIFHYYDQAFCEKAIENDLFTNMKHRNHLEKQQFLIKEASRHNYINNSINNYHNNTNSSASDIHHSVEYSEYVARVTNNFDRVYDLVIINCGQHAASGTRYTVDSYYNSVETMLHYFERRLQTSTPSIASESSLPDESTISSSATSKVQSQQNQNTTVDEVIVNGKHMVWMESPPIPLRQDVNVCYSIKRLADITSTQIIQSSQSKLMDTAF
jgi:hypothetical protein